MNHQTFISSDGTTKSHAIYWDRVSQPIATVQIVHGMAEYIARYADFAHYLNQLGFIVIGHDHLGHGDSLSADTAIQGFMSKGNSPHHILEDIDKVNHLVEEHYPNLPHFILGHSMGSFSVRAYLQKFKNNFVGAIFMGTGQRPQFINQITTVTKFLNHIAPTKTNKSIDKIAFSSYSKHFPENSSFNWLSKNQLNVKNYENDPNTGFIFTNNGFNTLFQLISKATSKNWSDQLNKSLPVLIVSGKDDPVGDYGKGPLFVKKELLKSGVQDVSLFLFDTLRHEILFEDTKEDVYKTIANWLLAIVQKEMKEKTVAEKT